MPQGRNEEDRKERKIGERNMKNRGNAQPSHSRTTSTTRESLVEGVVRGVSRYQQTTYINRQRHAPESKTRRGGA
jgi:hypothetical protein